MFAPEPSGEDETPEEVDVIKHLPTGLHFFLISDFDDNGKFSLGVECLNPPEDTSELIRRAQEAIRCYCLRTKSTPDAEQRKAEEWRQSLKKQPSIGTNGITKMTPAGAKN